MQIHPDTKAFAINNDWPGLAFCALLFLAGTYAVLQAGDIWMGAGIWALAGILTLAIIAHAHLNSTTTWLEFNEDKIVYQTGIFSHYKKMVPVGQITDTSTYASILDRLLGVSALRVNTAGSKAYEIDARNFRREDAESAHHEIYEHIKRHSAHKKAEAQAPQAHAMQGAVGGASGGANPFVAHHAQSSGAHEKKDAKK